MMKLIFAHHHARRGVALVIVLAALLLFSTLIVAFLVDVTQQREIVTSERDSFTARNLAETSLEIVSSQIKQATSVPESIWASQPGAIRSWKTDGTSDEGLIFKLYSAELQTEPTSSFAPEMDLPPADWRDQPAVYTDLNEPVFLPDPNSTTGESDYIPVYPIIDPSAFDGELPSMANNDPFFLEDYNGDDIPDPAMPVRWLYILEDGNVVAGINEGGFGVELPGSTATNEVIGRIAFWTDDETSRLNINTATGFPARPGDTSEENTENIDPATPGAFWSPPYTASSYDRESLALSQPLAREYQRQPGHVFTTALPAALNQITTEQLFSISPLAEFIGSKGGTETTALAEAGAEISLPATEARPLYPNVSEILIFNPLRELEDGLTVETLRRTAFSLTTSNHSSDLNLFGLPRISIWPVHADDSPENRTALDNRIANAVSVTDSDGASFPFYFTRRNPSDPTADFSERNEELLKTYLVRLTSQPVPGFADKTFADKWGEDHQQILTQIYDYIRATNLLDQSTADIQPYAPGGQVTPSRINFDEETEAQGFGRYVTLSEFGFLVTRRPPPDDAAPPPAEVLERRYFDATFLFELFSPAQGYGNLRLSLTMTPANLDKVSLAPSSDPRVVIPEGGETFAIENNIVEYTSLETNTGFAGRGWGGIIGPASLETGERWKFSTTKPIIVDYLRPIPSNGEDDPPPPDEWPVAIDFPDEVTLTIDAPAPSEGDTPPFTQTFTFVFEDLEEIILPFAESPETLNERLQNRDNGGLIRKSDLVRSLTLNPGTEDALSVTQADLRFLAATYGEIPAEWFSPSSELYFEPDIRALHTFGTALSRYFLYSSEDDDTPMQPGNNISSSRKLFVEPADETSDFEILATAAPNFSTVQTQSADSTTIIGGDWDTGTALALDGPYINKADDGISYFSDSDVNSAPYYHADFSSGLGPEFFSPHRIAPSPVIFGSLPTGIQREQDPWRTLLFSPNPPAGDAHPGFADPPEHLLLDLFHLPQVDPVTISGHFSTQGRVNLNAQILPFTYIQRETALRGLLQEMRIPVIPSDSETESSYKNSDGKGGDSIYFHRIDVDATIRLIREHVKSEGSFRSATQLCELYLVPQFDENSPASLQEVTFSEQTDQDDLRAFWSNNELTELTGDNLRELPYSHLLPRVTTKSNSFRVYFRAQHIKKSRNSPANGYIENLDRIASEFRGSARIERYLPNISQDYVDYATDEKAAPLDSLHRIRMTDVQRFTP